MEQDKSLEPEDGKGKVESNQGNEGHWIDRTEAFIDEAADKVHQSEAYRKVGKSMESATLKIFRQAGKWWGKI